MDKGGRIVLPPELTSRYGVHPGMPIGIDETPGGLRLRWPVNHLAKVYIEPTNRCNLECRTCIRNVWDEPLGNMDGNIFLNILEGLRLFSPVPTVFFGGFGEPLAHPDIMEMVAQAKGLGASVELITNGTMLTRDRSEALIEAGLDLLWVSLDGAKPESYADVRLGAVFPEVIANLAAFRDAQHLAFPRNPQLGIVFVAMKRNIADLPDVITLGSKLGAQHFLVTNLLPYTEEMKNEILYTRALVDYVYGASVDLPKMDMDETTWGPLVRTLESGKNIALAGIPLEASNNHCPFIGSHSTSISWEGNLSPCLPLLRSNRSFLDGRERFSRKYIVGNLNQCDLKTLWNQPEYVALRRRIEAFDFSPCVVCAGCDFPLRNEEDCYGNQFPTCGGCLWAQGLIRCP